MKTSTRNQIAMGKLVRNYLQVTSNRRSAKFWTIHLEGIDKPLSDSLLVSQFDLAKVFIERNDITLILEELHSNNDGVVLEDMAQTKRFFQRVGIDARSINNGF
ncbi:hypothetical protein ACPV5U_24490 [Vibrio mediterranei]